MTFLRLSGLTILIFMLICVLTACHENTPNPHPVQALDPGFDSSLVDANKYLKRTEEQLINEFIKRYHWKMQTADNGLRYWIYQSSHGQMAENKKIATIEYTLSLISGDTCYTSQELGPKRFELGKYEKESGLNQGVLYMRCGEKAKFIIPSYLGFGLMGDGNRIPKKSTLVYDVELIKLQ